MLMMEFLWSRIGCHKRILLVLYDVNQYKLLEKLVREPNWFGQGSRVNITTREEHLLIRHKVFVHLDPLN